MQRLCYQELIEEGLLTLLLELLRKNQYLKIRH